MQREMNIKKNDPIPIIEVKGNHYEVGRQLGARLKDNIANSIENLKIQEDWKRLKSDSTKFLLKTEKYLPEYVSEIQGAADGADLELPDVFTTLCEELFSSEGDYSLGCSDLAATNDVTDDGSVLVGHNNDISASLQDAVTIVHYKVDNEPEIFAVGAGGLGISVGYNSAGISLTGNKLNMNDMQVGIPRMLLVRKILASSRICEAIDAAIIEHRASNYNQFIANNNGEIYSIESSATDYDPIYAAEGYLAHTNHFCSPKMKKYELYPNQISDSLFRQNRCNRMLKSNLGNINLQKMKEFLSDHTNYPYSICFHGEEIKTVFSIIINLSTQQVWLAKGNPCEAEFIEYNPFKQ